jgi:RNase adaptor protein for sRNA GlmZ degradation
MDSIEAIAQRMDNAHQWLVDTLKEQGAGDYAEEVAHYYIKEKIVKRDLHVNSYKFSHGVFLDSDVIKRAVELVKKEEC